MNNDILKAELGRYLAELRVQAGYETRRAFAREHDLEESKLSKLETGQSQPRQVADIIAVYAEAAGIDEAQVYAEVGARVKTERLARQARERSQQARDSGRRQRRKEGG